MPLTAIGGNQCRGGRSAVPAGIPSRCSGRNQIAGADSEPLLSQGTIGPPRAGRSFFAGKKEPRGSGVGGVGGPGPTQGEIRARGGRDGWTLAASCRRCCGRRHSRRICRGFPTMRRDFGWRASRPQMPEGLKCRQAQAALAAGMPYRNKLRQQLFPERVALREAPPPGSCSENATVRWRLLLVDVRGIPSAALRAGPGRRPARSNGAEQFWLLRDNPR